MKVESLHRWKAAGDQDRQDGLTKLLCPYLKDVQSQP